MKRVNISIDLEDSDILIEGVKKVLEAQSKQIARKETDAVLTSEITRIINARLDHIKREGSYSSIASRVANELVKTLSKENLISEKRINEMIELQVHTYLDKKLNSLGGVDKFIQSYLDKSLIDYVTKKRD